MGIDSSIFSHGKVGKTLLKFAIPAIISLLVAELYNMVDTFFVGRAIGPIAIGALTVAFPIQRFISAVGLMIAVGTSTYVSRSLGEKNNKKAKSAINTSIILTVLMLSALIIVMYSFKKGIILKLGASESIYPLADEYISIVIFGGLFQCLSIVMSYVMTSLGDTRVNLKSTSLGAVCNIIIDFILVSEFNFGVKGAAVATVISQALSCIYTMYKFAKVKKAANLNMNFEFRGSIVSSIICVGFSTFIIEISDAIVAVILNNILFDYGGDKAIIMIGTITKVSMFLFITIIGISSAMQPIAAFNYGAGNIKRVKEVVKKTVMFVSVTSLAAWFFMMVFSSNIIGLFLKDELILKETVKAFRIVISILPCVGIYYVSIYCYQSVGKAKTSLLLSIFRQIIVFIPILLVLVNMCGLKGAWISFPISDIISSVTGYLYIKRALSVRTKEEKEYNLDKKAFA